MSPPFSSPELPFAALEATAERIASPSSDGLPEDDFRFAIRLCREARDRNREAEGEFRNWLIHGAAGHVLRETMRPALDKLEAFVHSFAAIRETFGQTDLYTKTPDRRSVFIAEFNAFVDESTAFYQLFKSIVELAMVPPTEPDPEKLNRNKEAFARGEIKPVRPGFLTTKRT